MPYLHILVPCCAWPSISLPVSQASSKFMNLASFLTESNLEPLVSPSFSAKRVGGGVADFKRTSEGDCKKSAAVIFSDVEF